MKLNISFPATGCQKLIEIDDESKLRHLYDKRMSHEVEGDILGDDFKGYVFKISGGNDKQGFPMKQVHHDYLINTWLTWRSHVNHMAYTRRSVRG